MINLNPPVPTPPPNYPPPFQGKMCGVLEDLVSLLGECSPRLVTYAGGASSLKDLDRVCVLLLSR